MHLLLLTAALLASPQDTGAAVAPTLAPAPVSFAPTLDNLALLHPAELVVIPVTAITPGEAMDSEADTTGRRRAIRYSDMYYTRLKIHQVASYLTVPLFVAQYLAGRELWNKGDHAAGWARDAHGPLAGAIAGLFAVNTVTGVWNLWEGRKDPHGRTRRWVHGLSMIAADAGFVVVGATAPDDDGGGGSGGTTHRNVAIASMGVALGSYVMMLLWKD